MSVNIGSVEGIVLYCIVWREENVGCVGVARVKYRAYRSESYVGVRWSEEIKGH